MISEKTSKEKYVIVGFGWVGQANAVALAMQGYDVSYFDPATPERHYEEYNYAYDKLTRLKDVHEKDSKDTWYMVCVGDRVSEEGVQDISIISRALDGLKGVQGGIMLRSTILPDLLKQLPFDYYVPEFLHEKDAVEECLKPYLCVTGAREGARQEPSVFAQWRSLSRKSFVGTPEEASFIKYLSNLWNATRIAFVNEFGDAIGRPSDKKSLNKIEDIIGFMFDNRSYLRYGRSFGGHCLPKDTRAFMTWYSKGNTTLPLLHGVYASNTRHAELEKELPLIPAWYSKWPDRQISGTRALSELTYVVKKYVTRPSLIWAKLSGKTVKL
jgi:UDP-glucose 6-dehydrogenase